MLHHHFMRTTLDIDEDILQVAKEIAASRGSTAGKILSELARKALAPSGTEEVRNGVPLLPRRSPAELKPNLETVNRMRDEE